MKTFIITVSNKTQKVKGVIIEQDITPQYTFFAHKSIDLQGYYVISEIETGCIAYQSKGQRKKIIEEFLDLLKNNRNLYIQAIEKMKLKNNVEHQISLF